MDLLSLFGSFFILPIFVVIGYLIIRLAVRHAIDSSQTGKMIKEIYENDMIRKTRD